MLLSDYSIKHFSDVGGTLVDPFYEDHLQPCSYDVTLASKLIVFSAESSSCIKHVNAVTRDFGHVETREIDMLDKGYYALSPGQFVLGSTIEKVSLPDYIAARFEGKSSLGRMGLATHVTAGFIDAGFCGNVTLEMKNETPWYIVIAPGMRIGQLCFFELDTPARNPYGSEILGSHYQGQIGPTPVRK